ncbi:nucleoside ABC transporter ATP-binding protein [Longilinea arvoryzae]|uniref:Nucleoside ABC transporter ATP-binding protein n=1 Tax=Longilinea arvoryzae TaxID=360412 RepID=A0A0S7B973_9CHLR|nr:ABC transporter ATP-binding protein [Longilinea arvoryzae]GAP14031.1 nucleoside ABC transporter ATP-binding protein [Longilinea arvoryzae]
MTPILQLSGITKRFPGVLANDHIDLQLNEGEILALLGENGAGKTTLMNILYGLYQPDEGEISVRGKPVQVHSPTDAIKAGIGMVHQHFMLVPVFTVTENVMLGEEPVRPGGFLDRPKAAKRIREISEAFQLDVNPDLYVQDLPVGVQQRVEIIKLLYREADILIFDEPTAVLTPQEADELFEIMRSLAKQGKSIIFITHKLREVLAIADRIMVIRRGAVVGETTPAEADQNKLAAMMVGRAVNLEVEREVGTPGEVVLNVENLVMRDEIKQIAVNNVSFDIHAGEILGVAGVQGNGQTELVEAITGMKHLESGKITLLGHDISKASPRQITEYGSAHVPEDRQRDGLVLPFPIYENLVLCTYFKEPFSRGIILNEEKIVESAERLVKEFDIRTPSIDTTVGSLSGGNQQKVIIARELSRPIQFLIASQPTRGLDVGSIEFIHKRIMDKRTEGCAVLLVSPELDEVMELSDRIAVMYRGNIVTILPADQVTKEQVGLLMAGVSPDVALQQIAAGETRKRETTL